jgi:protein-disulfide isomerase
MIRKLALLLMCSSVALAAFAQAPEQGAPPSQAGLEKKVVTYLRELYAWGPKFQVALGPFKDSQVPGFYDVEVKVTVADQSDTGTILISKDGRFLFRGEINDLFADPFAANRALLHLESNPSKGPASARVTVVDFSDFQCPHCRLYYQTMKKIEPRYPQVRFVFKDFPLTDVHPWAMSASIAGRCVFQQAPEAFWKVHDAIFEDQANITPENAWNKFIQFAQQAGLPADSFKACMASPEARQAIEANMAEGRALKVASTPTIFVNGRPLPGGTEETLLQYIDYELASHSVAGQPHR